MTASLALDGLWRLWTGGRTDGTVNDSVIGLAVGLTEPSMTASLAVGLTEPSMTQADRREHHHRHTSQNQFLPDSPLSESLIGVDSIALDCPRSDVIAKEIGSNMYEGSGEEPA